MQLFFMALARRTAGVTIFRSNDDSESVHTSIDTILKDVDNVRVRDFGGYGHFTYDNLGGPEFPELLDELLH
jgi:hypothetical protein